MRSFRRSPTLLGIGLISLLAARPVLAFPPLPSSFYGTVKINGGNVPDGILVQATTGGNLVTETHTQTYQGESIYSLGIPGDNTNTSVVEGGKDGDTITFFIGGIAAYQTGVWKSGTPTSLNLSVSSAATLVAAQDTSTPVPTQTAIILVIETPTSLTEITQSSPTNTIPASGSSLQTSGMTPTRPTPTANSLQKDSTNSSTANLYTEVVIAGFILFIVIFIVLWLIRIRKPKVERP